MPKLPWFERQDSGAIDAKEAGVLTKAIDDLVALNNRLRKEIVKWDKDPKEHLLDPLKKCVTLCIDPWQKYIRENREAKQAGKQAQIVHKWLVGIYSEVKLSTWKCKELDELRHALADVELVFRVFLDDRGFELLHDVHKLGKKKGLPPNEADTSPNQFEESRAPARLADIQKALNAAGIHYDSQTSSSALSSSLEALKAQPQPTTVEAAKPVTRNEDLDALALSVSTLEAITRVLSRLGIPFADMDELESGIKAIQSDAATRAPQTSKVQALESEIKTLKLSESRLASIESVLRKSGLPLNREGHADLLSVAIEGLKSRQSESSADASRIPALEEETVYLNLQLDAAIKSSKEFEQNNLRLKERIASLEVRIRRDRAANGLQIKENADLTALSQNASETIESVKKEASDHRRKLEQESQGMRNHLEQEIIKLKLRLEAVTEALAEGKADNKLLVVKITEESQRVKLENLHQQERISSLEEALARSEELVALSNETSQLNEVPLSEIDGMPKSTTRARRI